MNSEWQKDPHFYHGLMYVLENEGTRYTNDPVDPGGCTKYGITLQGARTYEPFKLFTCKDIKDLTLNQAAELYYEIYWKRFKDIESERVQIKAFDVYVNLPPVNAIKVLQRAVNRSRPENPLVVDGKLGRMTLKMINSCKEAYLLESLVHELTKYYNKVVEANPAMIKYIKGWLTRAAKLPSHT